MRIGPDGVTWEVAELPPEKAARERLIAKLFVDGFSHYVAMQSDPSLAPFEALRQNAEANLDFTVTTALGDMLMELAEFAPLDRHGPTFADAPLKLDPKEKAQLAFDLIERKSAHQGGHARILVLYITEHGFWLDPIAIERLRRMLAEHHPRFDRVYYTSLHGVTAASNSEIYPGKAHHYFGDLSDDQLDCMRLSLPHPTEMVPVRTIEVVLPEVAQRYYLVRSKLKVTLSGIRPIRIVRVT
jgi:hypothetical protein